MKFLIQTDKNRKYTLELCFQLERSINFLNSFKNENHTIRYSTNIFGFQEMPKGYIPVGSIEFVLAYLQKWYKKTVYPINIPTCLMDKKFTKRKVFNGTDEDVTGNQFVKSNDGFKLFADVIVSMPPPKGNYQISEIIDILSEWRAFVWNGRLLGMHHYSGYFWDFPDKKTIYDMIDVYSKNDAPKAYTLDVGVTKKGTAIIEVHDFFSVGLYGFEDSCNLPYMLSQCWHSLIK